MRGKKTGPRKKGKKVRRGEELCSLERRSLGMSRSPRAQGGEDLDEKITKGGRMFFRKKRISFLKKVDSSVQKPSLAERFEGKHQVRRQEKEKTLHLSYEGGGIHLFGRSGASPSKKTLLCPEKSFLWERGGRKGLRTPLPEEGKLISR